MLAEPLLDGAPPKAPRCVVWQVVFFVNVFAACISFSIVMPSLYLYLSEMGSSTTFYAVVVAAFSVGEAVGSLLLGVVADQIGAKRTLQLCTLLALTGSTSYALADTVAREYSKSLGPPIVLVARLLQGIGSGGQQAVEQSYLSVAAPAEQRTELTSKLSTFACLGFIFGPALGAAVSQTPSFSLGAVRFTTFTKQGWVVAVLNVMMFVTTTFGFTEVAKRWGSVRNAVHAQKPQQQQQQQQDVAQGSGGKSVKSDTSESALEESGEDESGEDGGSGVSDEESVGVWVCIMIFFVHFNGFAVQETITTPLVEDWFGWDEVGANLLFTAAGLANLLVAVAMSYLSGATVGPHGEVRPRVEDRTLLWWSLALAVVGWVVMVPPDGWGADDMGPMSVPQFGIGFALVTVAFPVGRGVCLSMVGKLLGDQPQGTWMGIMFALGAIARIAGPFWAVTGYYMMGALPVFGSTALLFLASLAAIRHLWEQLVPPPPSALGGGAPIGGGGTTPRSGGSFKRRTRVAGEVEAMGTPGTRRGSMAVFDMTPTPLYHRSPSLTPTGGPPPPPIGYISPLSQRFLADGESTPTATP